MIEDDGDLTGEAPFPRSYDFFKHMTGIALVSIGGVFAFLDGNGARMERRQVISVLIFLGLSGVTSLLMATTLAGVEVKPTDRAKLAKSIRYGQFAVTFLLSIGLGNFVPAFVTGVFK
ncbi:hypothetical protein [uncultured Sphingomonas sp.]|uniref:hypothetical protein n=1 Tax=uncultured Sphingomonas sp. TaxID=158754 RepID=UPI0025E7CABF|nr:hypothetical protein [uncultured Sphingomonas sp.]